MDASHYLYNNARTLSGGKPAESEAPNNNNNNNYLLSKPAILVPSFDLGMTKT